MACFAAFISSEGARQIRRTARVFSRPGLLRIRRIPQLHRRVVAGRAAPGQRGHVGGPQRQALVAGPAALPPASASAACRRAGGSNTSGRPGRSAQTRRSPCCWSGRRGRCASSWCCPSTPRAASPAVVSTANLLWPMCALLLNMRRAGESSSPCGGLRGQARWSRPRWSSPRTFLRRRAAGRGQDHVEARLVGDEQMISSASSSS